MKFLHVSTFCVLTLSSFLALAESETRTCAWPATEYSPWTSEGKIEFTFDQDKQEISKLSLFDCTEANLDHYFFTDYNGSYYLVFSLNCGEIGYSGSYSIGDRKITLGAGKFGSGASRNPILLKCY